MKFIKNIYYFFRKFKYLKVLNSPFKSLKLKVYFGDIIHGTPYFFPRKITKKGFKPVKYLWLNVSGLGWKPKWDEYRFEWSPYISLVIFGKQLFIEVVPIIEDNSNVDHYWEAWLNWEYRTDKYKSKIERFKELINKHSCTWISHVEGEISEIDYYEKILSKKYLKLYNQLKYENLEVQ